MNYPPGREPMATFMQHQKIWLTVGGAIKTWEIIAEDDKLTWSDAPAIGTFIGGTALLWAADFFEWRNFSKKPLFALEAAIVVGGIASYAIGGKEGLFMYKDFITDPVDIVRDPKKRDAFIQASEITLGLLNPLGWLAGQAGEYVGEKIGEYKDDIFKNRFLTGPDLPF